MASNLLVFWHLTLVFGQARNQGLAAQTPRVFREGPLVETRRLGNLAPMLLLLGLEIEGLRRLGKVGEEGESKNSHRNGNNSVNNKRLPQLVGPLNPGP